VFDKRNYTYQRDFAKKYFSQGIEAGRKEGYGELLREQLLQRFGELPADVMARLDEAEANTLLAWGRRVLTAGSLADVFASEPG
jgi:hypothetical protein